MIQLLAKTFIHKDMEEREKRRRWGMICAIAGIGFNLFLAAIKLIAGSMSGALAITADALNNLSDVASSVVTMIGFRLAGRRPDREHPYGHGRAEYLAGLGVSLLILAMAVSILKDAVGKILHPEAIRFDAAVAVILCVSICVKLYMASYNRKIGDRIGSVALHAVASDALSDCVSTSAVLLTSFLGGVFGIALDGWCGAVVGILIFITGIRTLKETLDPLLGQPPTEDFVRKVESIVREYDPLILDMHDLLVHDYGPGRRFISLHAEVPAEKGVLELHDMIDGLEKKLSDELSCFATVHMDPMVTTDPELLQFKDSITDLAKEVDPSLMIHDFRKLSCGGKNRFEFDCLAPMELRMTDEEIRKEMLERIRTVFGPDTEAVIEIDRG